MKRLLSILIVVLLAIGLSACGELKEKNNDEVKVIPKAPKHELTVVGIDELHKGFAQDISPDGKTLLFSWDEDVPDEDKNGEITPPNQLYSMNLTDKSIVKVSSSDIHQSDAKILPMVKILYFLKVSRNVIRLL